MPSKNPSAVPSLVPSASPSRIPSADVTYMPTPRVPTLMPSALQTRIPTHFPVVRPSLSTPQVTNATYHDVAVSVGGSYVRPVNNYTNFIVNATQDVTILGAEGVVMFTSDLTSRHFRFAHPQDIPSINKMKRSYGPIIAAAVVFGSLMLFIVYKFGEQMRHNYK
eukprot:gene47492-biopygen34558